MEFIIAGSVVLGASWAGWWYLKRFGQNSLAERSPLALSGLAGGSLLVYGLGDVVGWLWTALVVLIATLVAVVVYLLRPGPHWHMPHRNHN